MKLMTKQQRDQMIRNGKRNESGEDTDDLKPVVKLFTPWAAATWLLSELDPNDPDIAFGLCDLGLGEPELGYVSLDELMSVTGPAGLKVERDLWFKAEKTLSAYADEARANREIVA